MPRLDPDENGWVQSASAWIDALGDAGDFSRQWVLDRPMLAQVSAAKPETALDVGCGEGRFCRLMQDLGVKTTGLDPVPALIAKAKARDPLGTYVTGFAEQLPFSDNSFDAVVSYLSLIDIDNAETAILEMARVLKPGGHIVVGTLTSFTTSGSIDGERFCRDTGERLRPLGDYLTPRKNWVAWDDIKVQNWHRPLAHYMGWFLAAGLDLRVFEEPHPYGGPPDRVASYHAYPYLMMMVWQKP